MRILILLYALLVVFPTGLLAWWAWRGAGLEHDRLLAGRRDVAGEYANLLASAAEGEIARGARGAEASGLAAYKDEGGGLRYDPASPREEPRWTAEEHRSYLLSRRGGESYEAGGDPARALDAYTFHLARIRSPDLRARLRLAAARAASAAGEAALARGILEGLFADGAGAMTEEGYPADLLAAAKLLAEVALPGDDLRAKAADRLLASAPRLTTPLLARWGEEIAPGDARLGALVEERRALERAVAARPEVLASREAALTGSSIVFARDETISGRRLRAVRLAPFAPPDALFRFTGHEVAWHSADAAPRGEDVVVRPVPFGPGGAPACLVSVRDTEFAAARRLVDGSRARRRASVALQAAVVLAGGTALVYYLLRERELARLRIRLLANVSHELKTPVTSIRMFAEMLSANGADADRTRTFGGHILRESERLSHLVGSALDLAWPKGARPELPPEPVDLGALLRPLAEIFSERARAAGVDFRLEGADADAAPLVLETRALAVERILLNILDNALKYRRPESPSIVLALEPGEGGERGARIVVRDNGPGISKRDRERIFEEFYRARYDDYAVKGAGLGLAIARRLARELGGDLTLESREGEGSTFTLRLPEKAPVKARPA